MSKRNLHALLSADGINLSHQQAPNPNNMPFIPFPVNNDGTTAAAFTVTNNNCNSIFLQNNILEAQLLRMHMEQGGILSLPKLHNFSCTTHDIQVDQHQSTSLSAEQKAEKNRERNRAHAKRTRLRKKEMMETMKLRLLDLQRESARLEQLVEEKSTANILLALSDDSHSSKKAAVVSGSDVDQSIGMMIPKGNIIDQLRQKVRIEAASAGPSTGKDKSASHVTKICSTFVGRQAPSPSSSFAVKISCKELNVGDDEGISQYDDHSLTAADSQNDHTDASIGEDDLRHSKDEYATDCTNDESDVKLSCEADIKRERNRMHAKLTRDRKKLFTNKVQQTIEALEEHIQSLRKKLLDSGSCSDGHR